MEESKIVIAIRQYQRDYAWDKSLITPGRRDNPESSLLQGQAASTNYSATYLEDFVAGQSKVAGTK